MSFQSIEEVFDAFSTKRILVLGDTMIDTYVFGRIDRMSPEAPVPVIVQERMTKRLGGAANVALNLKAFGCEVILASVIGSDENGDLVKSLLKEHDLSAKCLISTSDRITTEKRRIIGGTKQVARVDIEETSPIHIDLKRQLKEQVFNYLPEMDALIFQDYDKGVLTADLIEEIILQCKELSIPVVVDPKERNYFSYGGVNLFKPNLREFEEAHQMVVDSFHNENFQHKVNKARQELQSDILLLTLSEDGLIITDDKEFEYVPARDIDIKDVSGAGDTVVAIAALCLTLGLSLSLTAQLANEAGALVCEEYGVTSVSKTKLSQRVSQYFRQRHI